MASTTRLPTAFPGKLGPRLESGWSGLLAVFAAATLLMTPAFLSGQILGISGALNVNWSAEFARELLEGELYPRWLPGMSRATGSPVFYFYAPLPFYLTAPFHLVVGPKMAVVIGSWLMLALSGIAFMALARAFVGSIPATIAAVVFMAMPYHLAIDVWYRAAYGEQAAYIFQPLCLLCAWRLDRGWNWALGLAAAFAGLLLSHLPSALLFAPFVTGFCLWAAWRGNWRRIIVRAASAALLSGGLAAAYIGPALLFQDYIQAEFWGVHKHYNFFVFARNNLYSWILALGLLASFKAWRTISGTGTERALAPWLITIGGVTLIATPLSAWLWELFPVLQTVQFPYRVLVTFDVAMCMMLAVILHLDGPGLRQTARVMVVALLSVTALFGVGVMAFGNPTPVNWQDHRIKIRADAPEYMPSCKIVSSVSEAYRLGYSDTMVEDDLRRASEKPDPRRLPVYYYPFLEVIADGTVVPTRCDPTTGFIVADLPEGAKTVEVRRRMLPLERNALLVSMASLAVLLGGAAWSARRPISRRAAARV